MSAAAWSDRVDIETMETTDATEDINVIPATMETSASTARASYSDVARDPAINTALIPDVDDLNIIDERLSALLGNRPPAGRSSFEHDNYSFHNRLPDRPCTAYFYLQDTSISSEDIFSELSAHGLRSTDVRCLQRNPAGHTYITFSTNSKRNTFLKKSSFVSRRQASNCNLVPHFNRRVFVAVYDAPYELANEAIAHRLSRYGNIESHRRSSMQNHPSIHNGNRTFCFNRLSKHIPSFIRFGKFLLRVKYSGQLPTCRKCHCHDHQAKDCPNTVCFNCDGIGHTCHNCPTGELCLICRSSEHRAAFCPFSWKRDDPDYVSDFDDDENADNNISSPPPPPVNPSTADINPPSPADSTNSSSSSGTVSSGSTSTSSSSSSSSSAPLQSSPPHSVDLPSQIPSDSITDSALVAAVSDVEVSAAVVPVVVVPVPDAPVPVPVLDVDVPDVPVVDASAPVPVSNVSPPAPSVLPPLIGPDSPPLFSSDPSSLQVIPPTPVLPDPDPSATIGNVHNDPADAADVTTDVVAMDGDRPNVGPDAPRPARAGVMRSSLGRKNRAAPYDAGSGPPSRKSTAPVLPTNRKRSSKPNT